MNQVSTENSDSEQQQKKKNTHSIALQVMISLLTAAGVFALFYPALKQSREISKRKEAYRGSLKTLGHLIRGYSQSPHTLPMGGNTDSQGTPLHGWMTKLLPYINEAAMAREIDHSQPWNAPDNRKVFTIVVPLFLNSHMKEGPQKNSQGYGLTHFSANSRLFPINDRVSLEAIEKADGLSNTILIGEINSSFPAWGSANNVRDPAQGLDGCPDCFGSPHKEGAYLMFANGSVRFINQNIDSEILKALSTPAGGEPIPEQDYNNSIPE